MTSIGLDPLPFGGSLYSFHNPSGQYGVTATITTNTGRHLYEGDHPNELMNPGRSTPIGEPDETTRQFISDFYVQLLVDAYGYTVVLPSTFNTAHVSLDSQTGTLLVQGRNGSLNDTINVDVVGANIRVQVNGTTEVVPFASVTQLVIAGNGGTDSISVQPNVGLEALRRDVQYVVSSNEDSAVAGTLGDGVVDLDAIAPGSQVALRAAIVDANGTSAGSARSIYVPRGNYNLTLSGSGGDTQGDLDINRKLTIIGTGAGATVIDASTLATRDRLFEIVGGASASLDLQRLTLTGGQTAANGGAISVGNNTGLVTELKLAEVAIVGNSSTTSVGGGVYVQSGAGVSDVRSVITANTSTASQGGGGIYLEGSTSSLNTATAALYLSIVANNSAPLGPDLRSGPASGGGTFAGVFNSVGGNLIGSTAGSNFATGGLQASDHVGPVDYVVTSVVDSFNDADNVYALSVREAVNQSNLLAGTQTIWLAAWSFVLTRDRAAFGGGSLTDLDAAFGDLDITESLNIRGSGSAGATSVRWRSGVDDAVFDLIGDFNGDGITSPDDGYVSGSDFLIWQRTLGSTNDLRADADDNGVIEGADLDLWELYYGNTLTLMNLI